MGVEGDTKFVNRSCPMCTFSTPNRFSIWGTVVMGNFPEIRSVIKSEVTRCFSDKKRAHTPGNSRLFQQWEEEQKPLQFQKQDNAGSDPTSTDEVFLPREGLEMWGKVWLTSFAIADAAIIPPPPINSLSFPVLFYFDSEHIFTT
ncbi:hypothetical protein STEG23_026839 [Scotinomys teguina]